MTILACSGFDEGPGANFTPPTLGEFMKKRESEIRILREARAGAIVTREARLFHERQARKHGINTSRGLAHFRASKMFTREASKLQEMFENGGEIGELPPKAVIKANKAAMMFHKKQAEKNGLDSDVGHAHVAAMEHHADIIKKAKAQGQQPQQEANEGGPGSGPHGSSGLGKPFDRQLSRHRSFLRQLKKEKDPQKRAKIAAAAKANLRSHQKESREALPGYGGKQSPVPVPKKSDMPNQDEKDPNKPPVNLNPSDANKQPRKLQQTAGAHAGMIRAGGPGSGRHSAEKRLDAMNARGGRYSKPKSEDENKGKYVDNSGKKVSRPVLPNKNAGVESRRSAIERFGREAERLDMGTGCDYPKGVGKQVEPYLVTRQPRTKEAAEGGPGSGPRKKSSVKQQLRRAAYIDRNEQVNRKEDRAFEKLFNRRKKESRRPILESRRNEDEFDDGTPRPIDLKSIYQKPERTNGWKNSNVYSPAIPKFEKESRAIIREY